MAEEARDAIDEEDLTVPYELDCSLVSEDKAEDANIDVQHLVDIGKEMTIGGIQLNEQELKLLEILLKKDLAQFGYLIGTNDRKLKHLKPEHKLKLIELAKACKCPDSSGDQVSSLDLMMELTADDYLDIMDTLDNFDVLSDDDFLELIKKPLLTNKKT